VGGQYTEQALACVDEIKGQESWLGVGLASDETLFSS